MRFEQWLSLVRTRIVIVSLCAAWALSFLTVRQTIWLDWMALMLVFWTVYQPQKITLIAAFALGILVDVQQASRMGEHALMYIWLVYAMRLVAPRLQFAPIFVHAIYATALLIAVQLIRALVYMILLGAPVKVSTMVWLLMVIPVWLLLAVIMTRGAQSKSVGDWMAQ